MVEQAAQTPPYWFDVVLSDFGREAAFEYVRQTSQLENRVISHLLTSNPSVLRPNRCCMTGSVIGVVSYIKQRQIAEYKATGRPLDSGILLGVGGRDIPGDVTDRIIDVLAGQIGIGILMGDRSFRVTIPCNTLGLIEDEICEGLRRDPRVEGSGSQVIVRTSPSVLLEAVGRDAKCLVLGTGGALRAYSNLASKTNSEVIELSNGEQDLIEALVAESVGGDPAEIERLSLAISKQIVEPHRAEDPNLVVIEACTDFDNLGFGHNSLALFASQMVADAYGMDRVQVEGLSHKLHPALIMSLALE